MPLLFLIRWLRRLLGHFRTVQQQCMSAYTLSKVCFQGYIVHVFVALCTTWGISGQSYCCTLVVWYHKRMSVCNAVQCGAEGQCGGLKVVPSCSWQCTSCSPLQTLTPLQWLSHVTVCWKLSVLLLLLLLLWDVSLNPKTIRTWHKTKADFSLTL